MTDNMVLVRDVAATRLLGNPAELPINLVAATLIDRLGSVVLDVSGQQMPVPALLRLRPVLRRYLGRSVVVGIRPEHVRDALEGPAAAAGPAASVLHGTARSVRDEGPHRIVHLELADAAERRLSPATLVARVGRASTARVGAAMMLAVEPRHLWMFDPGTGRPLW
jgi:ABC-type sugar transport system ATPase subunit